MARLNFISSKGDCAESLESFINGLPDNTTLVLKGECYLSRKVFVKNKKGLAIVGEDAKIITAFDPMEGFYKYSGAFDFEGCENLTLKNLIFDTDKPVNSTGVVTSVAGDGSSFVVKMLEGCVLDGNQTIFWMFSMDKDGSPDSLLGSYEITPMRFWETARLEFQAGKICVKVYRDFPSESVSASYTEGRAIINSLKIPLLHLKTARMFLCLTLLFIPPQGLCLWLSRGAKISA